MYIQVHRCKVCIYYIISAYILYLANFFFSMKTIKLILEIQLIFIFFFQFKIVETFYEFIILSLYIYIYLYILYTQNLD